MRQNLAPDSAGLGGTGSALHGRVTSLQTNPAANAFLEKREASATFLSGLGGGQHGLLAVAWPFGRFTATGGLQYFNAGSVDLNLTGGQRRTVTAEEDLALIGSMALEPLPGVAVGGSFKQVRLELAETVSANASLLDAGVLWRDAIGVKGFSAGAAWLNVGPDIKFEAEGDPPPRTLRYGVAYRTEKFEAKTIDPGSEAAVDLMGTADVVHALGEKKSPRVGLELGMWSAFLSRVALRFGWIFDRPTESLTFGLGLQRGSFFLDYALGAAGSFGNVHQIAIGARF